MKKLALSLMACLAVAGTSFAGVASSGKSYKDYKGPEPMETCFNDQELQLDIFGSWSDPRYQGHEDGFGGGIGINYFFMRYVGIATSSNLYDGGANGLWNIDGSLVLRLPIDDCCIAPYIFGGGGFQTNSDAFASWHAGGGIEYRIVPHKVGIFAEGRYIWGDTSKDTPQARLGVRVVF